MSPWGRRRARLPAAPPGPSTSPLGGAWYGADGRWHAECDCGGAYSAADADLAEYWRAAHVCRTAV